MAVRFLTDQLGGRAALSVAIAWGADLAAAEGTWTWTDVTEDVRQDPGIDTALGRGDEASRSQPATCTLVLDNPDGDYSQGGQSVNWPYVRRNTPVRVTIDPDDGGGTRTVFLGFAASWTPSWDAMGAIPTVTLEAAGTLRRLGQGAPPVVSPMRRYLTETTSVVAYWPMEEGERATYAPAVRGGSLMGVSGEVDWASSDSFACSAELPEIKVGRLDAVVQPYTDTGESQVRFLFQLPDNGLPDGTVLAYIYTSGTLSRFDVTYGSSFGGTLGIYVYNANQTLNYNITLDFSSVFPGGLDGRTLRYSLELTQNGANLDWRFRVLEVNGIAASWPITAAARTAGVVTSVVFSPENDADGLVVGHLAVQNDVTTAYEANDVLKAFSGEYSTSASSRLVRLCTENGLALTRYTGDGAIAGNTVPTSEYMGEQTVSPLLDLLRECEDADRTQIWDGRNAGISATTRRYREDGVVGLAIAAAEFELAGPFDPVDDDQRACNRATVKRGGGVTSTYEDSTGPLGTDRIGVYDESETVNMLVDGMALQHAGWLVHLGTAEGYRYPTLTIDLRATPWLAGDVLDLVPGSRVTVSDASDVLAAFPDLPVDLIVEGIGHSITGDGWTCSLRCSPAGPWLIGRTAAETGGTSEFMLRADTDGSTLNGARARSSTSLSVATPSGPLWSTRADDYPLTLSVGGVPVIATACSGTTSPQTFTVQPLVYDRVSGAPVKLHDPRPLGL